MTSTFWILVTTYVLTAVSTVCGKHSLHASMAKRSEVDQCYRNFDSDPNCPIVNVAFFSDSKCSAPMTLIQREGHYVRGNAQMLFDSAISAAPQGFKSIKILAATTGMGVGFAQRPDSDTLIMNMAWLSAASTSHAVKTESCIELSNVYSPLARYWTANFESKLNKEGYLWNPQNLPMKRNKATCTTRHVDRYTAACLEQRSWGAGGILELYKSADCSGVRTRQLFNSAQCEPLLLTEFGSIKQVEPLGPTVDITFSDEYFPMGSSGYHACGHRNTVRRPILPGKCQELTNRGFYVGLSGNDPDHATDAPDPGAVPLKKGKGVPATPARLA